MKIARPIVLLLTLTSVLLTAFSARADQAARYNAEGNRLYRDAQYKEAIRKFRQAQIEAPEERIIDYNLGTARARLNDRDASLEAFARIDPRKSPRLYALSRYNLGVLHYREAEQRIAEQQYQEAVDALKRTLDANREALRADRSLDDARFNYEVAKRRHDQLLEMMKDMPQEPQQQEPQDSEEGDEDEGDDEQPTSGESENDEQQQSGDEESDASPKPQDEQGQDEPADPESDAPTEEPSEGGETQDAAPGRESDDGAPASPREAIDQMSPEDARALLNALADEDRSALRRLMRSQVAPPMEHDW